MREQNVTRCMQGCCLYCVCLPATFKMDFRQLGAVFFMLLAMHSTTMLNYVLWCQIRDRPRRRWWVRPVNRVRNAKGFYANLVTELLNDDHEEFFSLYRMWPEQFKLLLELVEPHLQKRSIRTPLPTALRVAVTLLYLSQGGSAKLQHAEFRIGKTTTYKVVHEICRAIWQALQPSVLKFPNKNDWKSIAEGFKVNWQFPNCVGAIDGRHMRIQAPPMSGSLYHNYKNFFSMVLQATCDAKYGFTYVDIGSISDGGVWANTDFASYLKNNTLDLPDPCPLPDDGRPFPFVFIGDEAFPLSGFMMRPYPRRELTDESRVFNYRLSRARRTIENAFGIMTARWQILHKPLRMSAVNCENLFKAIVVLHNFAMVGEENVAANDRVYAPRNFADAEEADGSITHGEWRQHISPYFETVGRVGGNRSNFTACGLRDYLRDYFVSDIGAGQAPWQYDYALGRTYEVNM